MTIRIPPIQGTLAGATALTTISPRIYAVVAAEGAARPYTVWQLISAVPENQLSDRPEIDDQRVQVDFYSETQSEARRMMQAGVDALEPLGHIVFGPWTSYDSETKLFRWSFDIELWNAR